MVNNPFAAVGDLLRGVLLTFLPDWLVDLLLWVVAIGFVCAFVAVVVMIQIWLLRRVIARLQDRLGPNRVGPFGLMQSVADAMKLLSKEDVVPSGADKALHFIAPVLVLGFSLMVWAVIPWGPGIAIADINVGLLFVLAMGGIPTASLLIAGWASNNKYSMLGGMRAAAQFISYEVPAALAVLTPVLMAGTLSLQGIVERQGEVGWFIIFFPFGPIAFLLFLLGGLAESNQTPFDLVEAESELAAGFHTEYSGMRWGLFFLAEFANVLAISAIGATLFLGGWLPLPGLGFIPPYVWVFAKTAFLVLVFIWIRGTLPRIRYDQLMQFAWKGLLPVALLNVALTAIGMAVLYGLAPR